MDAGTDEDLAPSTMIIWAELLRVADVDIDDERAAELVGVLNRRGEHEVVEWALPLLSAPEASRRQVAAWVLGQHGYRTGRPFGAEVMPALARAARVEIDDDTREWLVRAIGHGHDPGWADELMSYAADSYASVREAVAASLPFLFDGPMNDRAINTLIVLTVDADPHVRDWATMSLGTQNERDSASIRAALRARLDDTDDDGAATSSEAARGLAERRDPVVLPYLEARLAEPVHEIGNLIVEAAQALGDVRLLPALYRLRDGGWQRFDPMPHILDEAISTLEALR